MTLNKPYKKGLKDSPSQSQTHKCLNHNGTQNFPCAPVVRRKPNHKTKGKKAYRPVSSTNDNSGPKDEIAENSLMENQANQCIHTILQHCSFTKNTIEKLLNVSKNKLFYTKSKCSKKPKKKSHQPIAPSQTNKLS